MLMYPNAFCIRIKGQISNYGIIAILSLAAIYSGLRNY